MATRLLCRRAAAAVVNACGPRYGGVRSSTHALVPPTGAAAGGPMYGGVRSSGAAAGGPMYGGGAAAGGFRPSAHALLQATAYSSKATEGGDLPNGLASTGPADVNGLPSTSPAFDGPPDEHEVKSSEAGLTQNAVLIFKTAGTLVQFVEIEMDKELVNVLNVRMSAVDLTSEVQEDLLKVVKAAYGVQKEDKAVTHSDSDAAVDLTSEVQEDLLKVVKAAYGVQKEDKAVTHSDAAVDLTSEVQEDLLKVVKAAYGVQKEDKAVTHSDSDAISTTEKPIAKSTADPCLRNDGPTSSSVKSQSAPSVVYAEWIKSKALRIMFGADGAGSGSSGGFFRWFWDWLKGSGVLKIGFVVLIVFGLAVDSKLLTTIARLWFNSYFAEQIVLIDEAKKQTYPEKYGQDEETVKVEFIFVVDGISVRIAESAMKKSAVAALQKSQADAMDRAVAVQADAMDRAVAVCSVDKRQGWISRCLHAIGVS